VDVDVRATLFDALDESCDRRREAWLSGNTGIGQRAGRNHVPRLKRLSAGILK
jgi:hypothetical protein